MKVALLAWFFLIPLFVNCLGIDVALVSDQCKSDQQSLLLQLKESLKFNQSKSAKLVTWDSRRDCCDWEGIICDRDGHIIGLDLSNESISGWLENSTGLFGLQYLQRLNLAFNNFNTTIPGSIENLTQLVHLNLSNAGFKDQIPVELSRMGRLVVLDLSISILYSSKNSFLKLVKPNLASLVQNLTNLTEIHLDGIDVSAGGKDWCKALSSSLPKLQVLSLANCYLSGSIDSSLANLRFLSVVLLDGNNFSATLPEFFANFSNLTALHLSSSGLLGRFPESILQVPSLEILELSNNKQLSGSLPEFNQNQSLRTLLLSDTNFSGEVPESLSNLTRLSRMELARCNFSGQIPSSVANLTQLVYVDFSSNTFTGPIPSFHMSRNLTHLDFFQNKLSGQIPSTHFEGLLNLIYIDLRYNVFTESIPSSLFAIPPMLMIRLSNNQFRGRIPEFSNVSSSVLSTLDLSSNKLEGSVPSSIFHLSRLNVLSLSSNKLSGSINLDWFQNLANLTTLDLSYNSLNVEVNSSNANSSSLFPKITTLKLASCNLQIFPDLGNQLKLYYLDLSDNHIPGEIPSWLWELANESLVYLNLSSNLLEGTPNSSHSFANLAILDLHDNQLRGKIPLPPPFATYVDFSNNNFTSSIPSDIGNSMTFIYFFLLANNNLTGMLPESICLATFLQVLDLSGNAFTGVIPPCLIENTTLGVLNLRRNKFNGIIPDSFQENCGLKTLDLSTNLLQGKVPKSLANCAMLEVLDFGNNQIKDEFPCALKNITKSLQVLILRGNQFYGGIGCPDVHGTWPMLQIIDLASNQFNGSLPEECLSTWKAMMGDGNKTHDHLKFETLWLSKLYYQDSITVTSKGMQMELVKILTIFTSIDFSNNQLEGPIPKVIGDFSALYVLNLSHNHFTGPILSNIGNLSQLESLDLSLNNLTGPIPQQLAELTFLSVLNLSYNALTGTIPQSTQLQSFLPSSYEGNPGLCGPPSQQLCKNTTKSTQPPSEMSSHNEGGMNWQFILTGMGFGMGAAAVVAPLLFYKEVNELVDDRVDRFLTVLLPMIGLAYYTKGDWRIETEECFDEDSSDDDEEEEEEEDHGDSFTGGGGGRYCVFCTKLDATMKRVVHDSKCSCYFSRPSSSSTTSSFSSSVSS